MPRVASRDLCAICAAAARRCGAGSGVARYDALATSVNCSASMVIAASTSDRMQSVRNVIGDKPLSVSLKAESRAVCGPRNNSKPDELNERNRPLDCGGAGGGVRSCAGVPRTTSWR